MSRQEGRASQRTLPIPPSVAQIHASLTRILLSLSGNDERLEGGLLRGQLPVAFSFQRSDEIVQRFTRMAEAEVCRESVYVGPASL